MAANVKIGERVIYKANGKKLIVEVVDIQECATEFWDMKTGERHMGIKLLLKPEDGESFWASYPSKKI